MQKRSIKYLAIILFQFIFFYTLYSQEPTDEVFKKINNISDTVIKVRKLLLYSSEKLKNNDTLSISYLNYSLKLSEKINYSAGLIEAYEQFIEIFETRNDNIHLQNFLYKLISLRESHYKLNPNDTVNINNLIKCYKKISLTFIIDKEYNIAIDFYLKILKIVEKNDNFNLIASTYRDISSCYLANNKYDKAIEYLLKSNEIYYKLDLKEEVLKNTLVLGEAYNAVGNMKMAVNYYFSALEISETLDIKSYISACNSNISKLFAEIGLYEKALIYNEKSLEYLEISKDTFSLTETYIRQAEILFKLSNLDSSLIFYNKTINLLKNKALELQLATAYNGMALIFDKQNNFTEANKYFLISLSIRIKSANQKDIANSYISLGKHYLLTNDIENAEIYLVKGYVLSQQINNTIESLSAAKSLSELYELKNEFDKAFSFQTIYNKLNDSIINQDVANTLAKLELDYEFENQQRIHEKEILDIKKLRTLLLFIIILLIAFVAYVLYSYRTIYRKNKSLADKTQEIEKQNILIKQKSEEFEKLSIVASHSENGVIIMDKEANIEWINIGGQKMYSHDIKLKKLQVGRNLKDVSSNENIVKLFNKCIKTFKSVHYEYFNNDYENPIWLQTTLTPIIEDGEIVKLIAVDSDVTEIKLAEQQIINQKSELQEQTDLLSLYNAQLDAQKIAMMETNEELQQQREELLTQTELLEQSNKQLQKLSIVASKTDNSIFITTSDGTISWVNDAFVNNTGYSLDEFKTDFGINIKSASSYEDIDFIFQECVTSKKTVVYTSKMMTKFGYEKWFQTTLTPIIDENNDIFQIVAIDTDITKVKLAEEKIAIQNQEIRDSITYASRIQKAILPMEIYIDSIFESYFILNKPRDIVSGDFYWFGYRDDKAIAAVADCTGHGIPGAFMSMLGVMSLNTLVYRAKDFQTNEILNLLKETIINLLHQRGKDGEARDGMDISICIFDYKNMIVQFSGANSPLYVVKNKNDDDDLPVIDKIVPNKMPIGYFAGKSEPSELYNIPVEKGDTIYLCSDGFIDQFGGEENKKFLSKNYKKLLCEINHLPMNKRKLMLENVFENWKGDHDQVDDIMIVGIEIV